MTRIAHMPIMRARPALSRTHRQGIAINTPIALFSRKPAQRITAQRGPCNQEQL
ncbi:hypothetical protein LL965_06815 [Xanthomonas cassavae CFBP 4642]|uniref:Uncharacterized protein n=1 Tax=Xanthomonas cassavae CFBP 4642 TaxID=1219375 RepID=A0ABS8HCC5_9XANT|nr:hypothetical protein [Xanthomonas cassavae]MCC4619818.1 hypothetical protein [Xanthomonas cassavae CFBP 4642]